MKRIGTSLLALTPRRGGQRYEAICSQIHRQLQLLVNLCDSTLVA